MSGVAKWIPDRKVWAGGLAGVAGFLISQAIGMDAEQAAGIAGALWAAASYFIPPSVKDIVKRLDDNARAFGGGHGGGG